MRTRRQFGSQARTQSGSGVIEGVLGLIAIIAGVVCGTLLILNTGFSTYYKAKIAFVASQAAMYCAGQTSFAGSYVPGTSTQSLENKVKPLVNAMLHTLNLPDARSVVVTLDANKVAVTVSVEGLLLAGSGDILPNRIALQDTGVALLDQSLPPALLTLSLDGRPDTMVTVPCYGKFVDPFSNGHISNLDSAPLGVAVFRNRIPGSYSQFCMSSPSGAYSQTLATNRQ